MANIRHLQKRLKAVKNIRRVTRTMEMISTSLYRSYFNSWTKSTDFYNSLSQLAYLLVTAGEQPNHPLMQEKQAENMAVLVIGSNRGLCGSYNSDIFRLLDVHINRAKRLQKKLKIYAYGRKVINYLRHRGITPAGIYTDFEGVPDDAQAAAIADTFVEQYKNGEIDYFGIIYTRFYSMASQHRQTLTVLPLTELIDDLTTRATVIWPWELSFEDFLLSPSADEILDGLATMMIRTSISSCFQDAALSEHLARVAAMRNATENSETKIDDLTRRYNQARQSQITAELIDIVGGAEAVG